MVTTCLVLLVSCSMTQDVGLVQQAPSAVESFHQQLNAQQGEQILSSATPEFQKAMSKDTYLAFFARIRRKLGTPISSKPTSIFVNHVPGATLIVAQFQTKFDKGDAQENFTWRVDNGKPRLLGYQIGSPLVLTD